MQGLLVSQEPRRISRGDIQIAHWDSGDGTPLVLITGLATPAASWSVLPDLLSSAGYRAIVMDNRDCGRSSRCAEGEYTIKEMAEDVAAVMQSLSVDSAYVLGISMGGMIAQELTLGHPQMVSRLMLMATAHGGPNAVPADAEFLTQMFAPAASHSPLEALRHLLGSLTGPGFAATYPEAIELLAQVRADQGSEADAFTRQWAAILGFDSSDRLEQIRIPTLVIHGTADRLVPPENGRKIAALIPGAELVELPDVGHLVPLEAPERVIELINGFFPVLTEAEPV